MLCVRCHSNEDKVIDSRMSKDGCSIRRRRECLDCGHRFTTYEQLENNDIRVVKRDGRREEFDREKLIKSFLKACEKRPISTEAIEAAVEAIIADMRGDHLKEIPSSFIGSKVMEQLEQLDQVAFVRYASIYREFQDVGEFIDEIQSLERRPSPSEVLQRDLFPKGA